MPFENPYRSDRVLPTETSAARKGPTSPTTSLFSYRIVVLALLFMLGGCAFYYENYMGSDLQDTTSAGYKLRGFATKLLHLDFQNSENIGGKDVQSSTSNGAIEEKIQNQQDKQPETLTKTSLHNVVKMERGPIHSTTKVIPPNQASTTTMTTTTTTTKTTTPSVQSPPLPDHMRDMALQRDGVDNKRRHSVVLPPPTAAPTSLLNKIEPQTEVNKVPILPLSPPKPIKANIASPIEKPPPIEINQSSTKVDRKPVVNPVKIIRPNPYDIKGKSKKPFVTKQKVELRKEDIKCDGTMDPFEGKPIENYVPPKSASLEKKYQWTKNVKDMMQRVRAITYGGAKLREKLEEEAQRLRMMRMKLFCEDLLYDLSASV